MSGNLIPPPPCCASAMPDTSYAAECRARNDAALRFRQAAVPWLKTAEDRSEVESFALLRSPPKVIVLVENRGGKQDRLAWRPSSVCIWGFLRRNSLGFDLMEAFPRPFWIAVFLCRIRCRRPRGVYRRQFLLGEFSRFKLVEILVADTQGLHHCCDIPWRNHADPQPPRSAR